MTYNCDDLAHWDAGTRTFSYTPAFAEGGTIRTVVFSATNGTETIQKTATIVVFRDFSALIRDADPVIPYNIASYNAGGADAPYIRAAQKIGDTYYSITQSAVAPTDWLNLSLYTSTDLVTWTPHAANPVISAGTQGMGDLGYLAHPSVIKIGSLWHCYYSANGEFGDGSVWLATSPDFVTWTKLGEVYTGHGISHANLPCVVQIGGQYVMYYWTRNLGSQANPDMEYATSLDGLSWSYGGVALSRTVGDWDYNSRNSGFDPWIIRNPAGFYEMIYTAYLLSPYTQRLGYAVSADGFSWHKFQGSIVAGSGIAGRWDEIYPGDGCLYFNGNDVWLWFAGANASLIAQGGRTRLIAP